MTYQDFYFTTKDGEAALRKRMNEDPQEVIDVRRRLDELNALLKRDDNRCSVSRDQQTFLTRILGDYP